MFFIVILIMFTDKQMKKTQVCEQVCCVFRLWKSNAASSFFSVVLLFIFFSSGFCLVTYQQSIIDQRSVR